MRSGHLVIGAAIIVMGCAIILIGVARQVERAAAATPAPACVTAEDGTNVRGETPGRAPVPSTTEGSTPPNQPAAGSVVPAASAEQASEPENRLFRFGPGGATMSNDEVVKVMALGKALVRHPGAKVAIEGFGDLPGTDPLMMGIAKHRAKVGGTLLRKAGVTEDRVTLTFSDMGTDTRLARSIRVTTTPSISEVEKP